MNKMKDGTVSPCVRPTDDGKRAITGKQGGPDRLSDNRKIAVMLGSSEPQERAKALEPISRNIRALIFVANSCCYEDTRLAAIERLAGNSKALEDIAQHSYYTDSRMAAIEKLPRNSEELSGIAMYCQHEDARMAAVERLAVSTSNLAYITRHTRYEDVKSAIVKKLVLIISELSNVSALIELTRYYEHKDIRMAAVERLAGNSKALMDVAEHSFKDSRKAAIEKLALMANELTDVSPLKLVAKYSKNAGARVTAVERLVKNKDVLADVADHSEEEDTRMQAREFLGIRKKFAEDLTTVLEQN